VVEHRKLGHWTLDITRDAFAGSTSCRMRMQGMVVEHSAARFDFGRGARTFEAIYRIDGGPPTSWRANAMALAANGIRLQSENIENPSNGWVAVPLGAILSAHKIAIRPSPRANARTFDLTGLASALEQADAAGCAFVPPTAGPP
jgi:hypothetical protein